MISIFNTTFKEWNGIIPYILKWYLYRYFLTVLVTYNTIYMISLTVYTHSSRIPAPLVYWGNKRWTAFKAVTDPLETWLAIEMATFKWLVQHLSNVANQQSLTVRSLNPSDAEGTLVQSTWTQIFVNTI